MEQKTYPNITVVNDADELIGYMQLPEAIEQGVRRRISAVLVFNTRGEMLVQKRSSKVFWPNVLDFSAGGHVDEGDDYETTAIKEAKEELGIDIVELSLVTEPFPTPYRFNAIYQTTIPDHVSITFNEEISEILFLSLPDLEVAIKENPNEFGQNFKEVWPLIRDKIQL